MSVCGAEKAKVSGAFGSVDVEIGSKVRLGLGVLVLSYLRWSYVVFYVEFWSFGEFHSLSFWFVTQFIGQ